MGFFYSCYISDYRRCSTADETEVHMSDMEKLTNSPEETKAFARGFAETLRGGEVICLEGDLGVGKTVFVKGLAEGLGIDREILSPTFTIVREYEEGRLKLNHFDVYRVDDPDEMFYIGFEEYLSGGGVNVIEWASNIEELLPDDAIRIQMTWRSERERLIHISRP